MKTHDNQKSTSHQPAAQKPFFGAVPHHAFFTAERAQPTPFFQPKAVSPSAIQFKKADLDEVRQLQEGYFKMHEEYQDFALKEEIALEGLYSGPPAKETLDEWNEARVLSFNHDIKELVSHGIGYLYQGHVQSLLRSQQGLQTTGGSRNKTDPDIYAVNPVEGKRIAIEAKHTTNQQGIDKAINDGLFQLSTRRKCKEARLYIKYWPVGNDPLSVYNPRQIHRQYEEKIFTTANQQRRGYAEAEYEKLTVVLEIMEKGNVEWAFDVDKGDVLKR